MTSIHVDLLGCQTRFCETRQHRTRIIERGRVVAAFLAK
jgi:hypothetical protein